MLQQNYILPDSYFLDSFVGGLKATLKPFVRAFKPSTLAEAVRYARLQEESLEATNLYNSPKSFFDDNSNFSSKPLPALLPAPKPLPALLPTPPPAFKLNSTRTTLTAAERREKQIRGLCYFCDQPYERGHKCQLKQTQLFTIEILGIGEDEEKSKYDDQCLEVANMELCVSVNALNGIHNFHTMRVSGYCGDKPLHILIDPGSTHNFLDLDLAKRLGLTLDSIPKQAVKVIGGNHRECQFFCKKFTWSMHNTEFKSDMFLIPLGSCDMVLGVQWLSELGAVKWDFKRLIMEFDLGLHHYVFKGIIPGGMG